MMRKWIGQFLSPLGLVNATDFRREMMKQTQGDLLHDAAFMKIYEKCRANTMTSIERMYGLYEAVGYVVKNRIPGEIVECGVWRGGSTMLCALRLLDLNEFCRPIHLFDTFTGMTDPEKEDVDFRGQPAAVVLQKLRDRDEQAGVASLEEVRANMEQTGYPEEKLVYIKGRVEDTIPEVAPESIALLRLDTDWYESTRHELEHLFPRLSPGGVLIIDDYGHWQGARKATDEYMKKHDLRMFAHRLDYTGRLWIK